MAAGAQTVPETDIRAVGIAGHQHGGTIRRRLAIIARPVIGLPNRQVRYCTAGLNRYELACRSIEKTGSAPPWVSVSGKQFEQRPGRDTRDETLNRL